MRTELSKVHHKGKVVDEIEIPVYESLSELQELVSDTEIVDAYNRANRSSLQNEARLPHMAQKIGKQKRIAVGLSLLSTEEITRFAGNGDGLIKYVQSPKVQALVDEKLGISADVEDES